MTPLTGIGISRRLAGLGFRFYHHAHHVYGFTRVAQGTALPHGAVAELELAAQQGMNSVLLAEFVQVDLERVDRQQLIELVAEAWRVRSSARLRKRQGEEGSRTN